jgi:hypothetical protein
VVIPTLIDLGELPHGGRQRLPAAATRRPRPYRTALAVLAVVLIGTLTGAAHRSPPVPPKIIAARLDDATFVGTDRLFVVRAGPKLDGSVLQNKIISAYALPAGNLLSLTTVLVSGAIFDVTSAGNTILISFQADEAGAEVTVALTAGTDIALWRRPYRMLGVSGPDGLVMLRENSPQFGNLHWYGVDLATGALRWALDQPVGGYLTEADYVAGFPRRLVLVAPSGRLEVRDTITAAILASTTIAVPPGWEQSGVALWPDGDLILLGDDTEIIAYAMTGLAERWRSPLDMFASYVGDDCGDAVCLLSPRGGGIQVLDRATGRTRWSGDRWANADRVGPYLLAGVDPARSTNPTLDVLDADTGRVRGGFGPWRTVGPVQPDGTVVGLRVQTVEQVVWYARLNPATLAIRLLGVADHVSGGCDIASAVLVCRRVDGSVGLWPLS